jgi:CheY-like chemotaxis protein
MPDGQVDLFYSYSHKDEELREQLDGHLALLKRRGVVRVWHDRKISAGDEWRNEINSELEGADVVLLLISADFLASDYCYDVELKRALARDAAQETRVIPVIVRACDGLDDAPFAHLQALPKDRRPVTSWPNRDEAWVDVVKGIRLSVEQLPARAVGARPPAGEPARAKTVEKPVGGAGAFRRNDENAWLDDAVGARNPGDFRPGRATGKDTKPGGNPPAQEADDSDGRGSLVLRILRKLAGGLAKGVVVGGPDMDASESRPAPPEMAPPPETPPAAPKPGLQRPRSGARSPDSRGTAPDGVAREQREAELMHRVISDFSGRVQAAYAGRNLSGQFASDAAAAAGEALAGIREQKRILWVDDAPAGNAQEASALLGLQIDVQQVTSTQAALDALAAASPPFDLVISDWNRVPRVEPLTPEGVRLLRLMRRAGYATPLIYYHGEFDEKRARSRAQHARREGAFGATSLPGELFALVRAALGDGGSPAPQGPPH